MSPPNGIYIIQGEVSLVVTAMRRTSRWTTHSHLDEDADPLLSSFSQLKDVLNSITALDELEPNVFLSPFLEVIRSEDTTGPITGLALTSVNKFLSYGLVDPMSEMAAAAIENVADAVTHARFVGTDPSSDEVVLMKILHVLRTMLLCTAGILLTNESVCEIMQSCFRICFEMRLSELLRKAAEHTLMDMVQLLFTRLPQFKEDTKWSANMKKLKMRAGVVDPSRLSKRKRSPKPRTKKNHSQQQHGTDGTKTQPAISENAEDLTDCVMQMEVSEFEHIANDRVIATTPVATTDEGVIDIAKSFEAASRDDQEQYQLVVPHDIKEQVTEATDRPPTEGADQGEELQSEAANSVPCDSAIVTLTVQEDTVLKKCPSDSELTSDLGDDNESIQSTTDSIDTASSFQESDFINPKGVRFTQIQGYREGSYPLIPYGLPCVRELYRFLVSLTNPIDRHNTDVMIHMGLSLLTVALEAGADHISSFNSLLYLVKDEMCRNLFMLLQVERLSLFAASLRVCFLLFESMRSHLKLQLENFLIKLSDIVISESPKVSYEVREITLESIVQLWRIPGLVTELYLNYDCDLYCSNLFEEVTKLLSKNAFPVSGLFTTHLLSLDALLTVIDSVEQHCHSRILNLNKSASGSQLADSEEKTPNDGPELKTGDAGTNYENEQSESRLLGPPTTGYCMAQQAKQYTQDWSKSNKVPKESKKGPQIKPNRMRITSKIPTPEEISIIKHKKKLYQMGTELFNNKPSKGIAFLQEQGLFATPLEEGEVVSFLKENPKLDKKMIGEYIANKKNKNVLEAFVKSFNFEDIRIDEALRWYLEAFRLPGEAPVISFLMEHFADHWHKMNGEPFANADAAFTLSYAVIMLNVDQHNHNVKKQNTPMTVAEFKKNVSKTNGGQDFDPDMLDDIYQAIRNDEIVMPAEHTGLVKENYYWKVLLRRGATKEGIFLHAPTGAFDHELFTLVWGSTVAAMSFVFDKSSDESIIQKSIAGFRKCAMISAHYGMSDVFDNLVISLCKFTTLLSSPETPENIPAAFGSNLKAQLAARTVFGLAHRHGDILREGWKNIMDCMLQLYRAKLLPKTMIEVEDFADDSGKISIMREENTSSQRSDSGVLSSFYSYFSLSDSASQKGPSPEEQEAFRQSQGVIRDCHLDLLILDSKFLREDSLQELVKALIMACQGSEDHNSVGAQYDEDSTIFFLELLIKVVLQNRDRVSPIWQSVRDHLYNIVVNASEHTFLVERAVVGLLRLAIRLLRREDIAPQVLTSLRMLLMMRPNVIHSMSRQVAYGLHDLLKTNAANIHSSTDWFTLFMILEVVGAGANPPPLLQVCSGVDVADVLYDAGAQSDSEVSGRSCHTDVSDRGYTSDSELYESQNKHQPPESTELHLRPIPDNGSWMLVNKEEPAAPPRKRSVPINQFSIDLKETLHYCDSKALQKSSETLSFLVRDAAHVTPHNFESCVHAIRTFVEASLNGGHLKVPTKPHTHEKKTYRKSHRSKNKANALKKSKSSPSHLSHHSSDDEGDMETAGLHSLSIQLLDLMHTLHTRAATIFSSWAKEEKEGEETREHIDAGMSTLWAKCWCPLLQGIARLCCDSRRQVRSQALTYLQRALLVHDLQTLSAVEWEACFNKVWFPLLTKLLENINPQDPSGMEETRMRASTLLCKVFLQHLSPLLSLSTFTALWLTILDFMEKYMKADRSDLLSEAIPESLKNMLLVMDTAAIFQTGENMESQLWRLTWDKIDTFLPNLKGDLFKPFEPEVKKIDRCENNSADTDSSVVSPGDTPHEPVCDNLPLERVTVVEQDSGSQSPQRSISPLMTAPQETTPGSAYILHPPLPNITTPTPGQPSVTDEQSDRKQPLIFGSVPCQSTVIHTI
ncbi:Golgi-specific brefeldin A-resistance guanine nucleotide exchange factor 1-like isoform X2 [Gigantopelta aegis]|uniref:Golgi-specific brefeldin A-resistance guanine nucleotide exchange factor 1-like isoform X2 n=1 Tax=Gigantopelta aegis TaxID=1735272 RepID=UPI001B88915F|nr:Golgi-specific brefeldin A-resistance guanine nucleotide exchange factor 1-like isoform X2 [Gigantopelta aegis]